MIHKTPFLRRRKYIINQDFQFRYIGLMIGLACAISLIFILAIRYQLNDNDLLKIFLGSLTTLTVASIFITHRIAGPIYALEQRMKQIAEEGINSTEFRIRRTDEFQELAESFNAMILTLQKQIQENKDKELKKVA